MIFLKANSWTQDEVNVYITLDKIPKAQVTWSPLFVSITNSDFIFNLHSLHETKSGTVSHTSSGSILTLSKCVKCEWKDLSYNDTKAALNDRKLKSLESVSKVLGDKQLEFNAAASKNDRSLISHQMKLEQSKRQVIQEKKNIEKALEEEELKRWTEEIESVQEPIENDNQESKAPLVDETLYTRITFEDVVLDDSEIDMDLVMKNVAKQLPPERVLPPPRQSSSINFEFSSRGLLPTKVARQSEDSKWIARIEQAQQQHVQSLNLKQNNELKVDDITENGTSNLI